MGSIFTGLLVGFLGISAAHASASGLSGFYDNGRDGSPLIRSIDGTSNSLDIEIYEVEDQHVRDSIRAALRRGVHVRIVQESSPLGGCEVFVSGDGTQDANCIDTRLLVSQVRKSGGQYVPFNKDAFCPHSGPGDGDPNKGGGSCVQHGKIAIFDDQALLVSTGNFNPTSLCDLSQDPTTCNRDYTLMIDDALVIKTVRSIFEHDLSGKSYDVGAQIPSELTDRVTVSPLSLEPLLKFIDSAETSIDIQNQYMKNPKLNAALEAKAKHGVQVNLMTESACAFGKPTAGDVKQVTQIYTSFENAGVSTRMFTAKTKIGGKAGYLHAKAIVVDGTRAWVGSVNGSTAATSANREFGYFFDEEAAVTKLLNTMHSDFADQGSESWQDSLNCVKDHASAHPRTPKQPR